MGTAARPLAVVTGASSGIGLELARCCVHGGYDVIICADGPEIHEVAAGLRATGANVEVVQADLAQATGVDDLYAAIGADGWRPCWPTRGAAWVMPFWTRIGRTFNVSSTLTLRGLCT